MFKQNLHIKNKKVIVLNNENDIIIVSQILEHVYNARIKFLFEEDDLSVLFCRNIFFQKIYYVVFNYKKIKDKISFIESNCILLNKYGKKFKLNIQDIQNIINSIKETNPKLFTTIFPQTTIQNILKIPFICNAIKHILISQNVLDVSNYIIYKKKQQNYFSEAFQLLEIEDNKNAVMLIEQFFQKINSI